MDCKCGVMVVEREGDCGVVVEEVRHHLYRRWPSAF